MDTPPTRTLLLDDAGFNQLVRGRDGYFLYNRNDPYIGRALEKYGEYSRQEMVLFRQIVRAGDVVVEVGANIGVHTLGLARAVGPAGRVLAFEPQRLVFQTLCANVALNSLDNVDCRWAALGTQDGMITVPELDPRASLNFGGVSLLEGGSGFQVACMPLDRLGTLPRVNFVKIDVEGMEAEVLRGGTQLLARFKPVLYVENDRIEKSEDLIRLIAGLGYRLYWHLPLLFDADNYFRDPEDVFPNMISCNMLCLHQDLKTQLEGFQEITDYAAHPLRR